jgi:hypothetical protein
MIVKSGNVLASGDSKGIFTIPETPVKWSSKIGKTNLPLALLLTGKPQRLVSYQHFHERIRT